MQKQAKARPPRRSGLPHTASQESAAGRLLSIGTPRVNKLPSTLQ